MQESTRYRILKLVHDNPKITQRELAQKLGFSLGKANYSIQALIQRGLVKTKNFKTSKNRPAYIYKLTPHGLEEKIRAASRLITVKMQEYEDLKTEIEELRAEVEKEQG